MMSATTQKKSKLPQQIREVCYMYEEVVNENLLNQTGEDKEFKKQLHAQKIVHDREIRKFLDGNANEFTLNFIQSKNKPKQTRVAEKWNFRKSVFVNLELRHIVFAWEFLRDLVFSIFDF